MAFEMNALPDNETWLLEAGDSVIRKKASEGPASLTAWEQLVNCLWIADYGMRNAGDLDGAAQLKGDFRTTAKRLARQLSLPHTEAAFSLRTTDLQTRYFEGFDLMCDEIRNASSD